MNDILTVINNNPGQIWMWLIGAFVVLLVNWFWREVLSDWISDHAKKKLNKVVNEKTEAERKLERLYKINRDQLHRSMQQMIDDCTEKGYRTVRDTSLFGTLWSDYVEIKGNHDGDILKHDFMGIKSLPTLELPIEEGYGNVLRKEEFNKIFCLLEKKVKED